MPTRKWIWDDETDPLVASLLDRGDVPRVNELLRDVDVQLAAAAGRAAGRRA